MAPRMSYTWNGKEKGRLQEGTRCKGLSQPGGLCPFTGCLEAGETETGFKYGPWNPHVRTI